MRNQTPGNLRQPISECLFDRVATKPGFDQEGFIAAPDRVEVPGAATEIGFEFHLFFSLIKLKNDMAGQQDCKRHLDELSKHVNPAFKINRFYAD
jgi:hypothetical protein